MDSQKNTESPDIGANTSIEDLINSKIEKINKTTGYTLDITGFKNILSSYSIIVLLNIIENTLSKYNDLDPFLKKIVIAGQITEKIFDLIKMQPTCSTMTRQQINFILYNFINSNKNHPIFSFMLNSIDYPAFAKCSKINNDIGYTLDITALNKIFSSDDILSLLYIVETELPYNAKLNPIHRRIKIAKQIRNKIYSLLKTNPEYSKIDKDTINDVLHQFFNDNKEFSPIFDYPPIISNDVLFSKIKKINCDTGYTIDIADLKNAFSNSDIFFLLNDIHIILLLNNEQAFSNKKIVYDQIKVFILMELETNPKYFNKNQDKINTAINAFLVKLSQSMIDLDMTIDNR